MLWTIGPLLPRLSSAMHSRTYAALVLAGHPIGSVTAALPTLFASHRFGLPRLIAAGAILAVAASTLFVWPGDGWWIVGARIGYGASATVIWQSVFAWTITNAGPARRAHTIGTLLAASTTGMVLAPQLGALADRYGLWLCATPPLLVLVAASRFALMPAYEMLERSDSGSSLTAQVSTDAAAGVGLASGGAVIALGVGISLPLALHAHGVGAFGIGAVLTAAYSAVIVLNPLAGRFVDRGNMRLILIGGLAGLTSALIALAFASNTAVAVVAAFICAGLTGVPAFVGGVLLSRSVAVAGVDQTVGQAMNTLAWAPAAIVGSIVGGAIAPGTTLLVLGIVTMCAVVAGTAELAFGRKPFARRLMRPVRQAAHRRPSERP
jgi:MFS family permease